MDISINPRFKYFIIFSNKNLIYYIYNNFTNFLIVSFGFTILLYIYQFY